MTPNDLDLLAQLRQEKDELAVRVARVEERLQRLEAERDLRASIVPPVSQ